MTDMRQILDILDEDIQVEDSFDLELDENLVIETGIVGLTEDAVIIEADEETLELLEASGIELDEADILKGPWGDKPVQNAPVPTDKPKAPVLPINKSVAPTPKFRIQDLYREFKNAPQVRQKMNVINRGNLPPDVKDDEIMNLATQYLEAKLGNVHPRLLGKYAIAFLDMNKAESPAQEMKETDGLDEIAKLAGIPMVGGKTPQELERIANVPTIQRIKSGETEPVDTTDYNTPPAMRDPMKGAPGYEKRRASLIKQGILKAEGAEVDECGYEMNPRVNESGPGDEPEHEDTDADDKRWDDKEDEKVDEAKYQGREVPLGKPMAGDVKKSKVYVRKPNGKVVKVNFGDKKMKIKKSNPKRRKSFRARHNCKNPGPRWKARYWSCRAW